MIDKSLLYQAAVDSLVSDRTSNDTWEKVARFAHAQMQNGSLVDYDAVAQSFKEIELQIKGEYGVSTMPSAWRSAKSIAIKALAHRINVMDQEGKVLGKTHVTSLVKKSRTGGSVADEGNAFRVANRLLRRLKDVVALHTFDSAERADLSNSIYFILNDLKGAPVAKTT